ncbi:hypothetical protein Hydth_0564 [Hydrogenobacter thermophilus TK-6]|uniref:Uncharacterized protein n=1 Tax=Hydrogenobacter thermophilus (strain DSM 6534 / IAM 12695 / TK-6) TaxID=608538 RepID=D3DGS5_HYDTT|nr:hypothetical protein [Hydrogenobacter thermophilus]ADO44963.1 hypothetical protein Hydth_0564 [Hydrogenobacter thermophilus TK-6]BAI69027.1 hypothetical protein HTH_0565 [Hydrogenobacter thermophilus TK-6]
MAKKSKKNWIQSAIKKPGSFTQWCKKRGYEGVNEECIAEGMKSKDPKTRARARLAKTLRGMSKRRRKK